MDCMMDVTGREPRTGGVDGGKNLISRRCLGEWEVCEATNRTSEG